jgi:hypothetical protein
LPCTCHVRMRRGRIHRSRRQRDRRRSPIRGVESGRSLRSQWVQVRVMTEAAAS